ncbi:uncharacterized protein LOC141908815 isoform X2 [Tubulanus polymorphus]
MDRGRTPSLRDRQNEIVPAPERLRPGPKELQLLHQSSGESSGIGTLPPSGVSSFDYDEPRPGTSGVDSSPRQSNGRPSIERSDSVERYKSDAADATVHAAYAADEEERSNNQPNFDDLFAQRNSVTQLDKPAKRMELDPEWDKYQRRGSRSPSPGELGDRQDSARSSVRSSLFLGVRTASQWVQWSQQRRASFRRRLEAMEQKEKDAEKNRVPTPIKKARKECKPFQYTHGLDESDDDDEVAHRPPAKSKKKKKHQEPPKKKVKITEAQYRIIYQYWLHKNFVRLRIFGIICGFVAFVIGVVNLTSTVWIKYHRINETAAQRGLYTLCGGFNTTILTSPNREFCIYDFSWLGQWHQAVIGLLVSANAFGFVATILSIRGVCVTDLPRKLYCYHSSGEIFVICALTMTSALIVYPVFVMRKSPRDYRYGYGYYLGWACAFFFYTAAFCMMLDDLIHTASKGCGCCGQRKRGTQHI